jgi:hypothetical protein
MAEPMSVNKVIHAAVRRDIARFAAALASFPDGSRERAGELATAWRYFFGELDYHHKGEHRIVWPALRSVGVSQALLDEMDAEHEELAGALAATGAAFDALEQAPTAANADRAAQAIATLHEVAERHLQHEERELEPVYWAKREAPEIKAIGRRYSRRSPFRSGDFLAWLMNGAAAEELGSLRRDVPPPVLAIFPKLFGRTYRRRVAPVWR